MKKKYGYYLPDCEGYVPPLKCSCFKPEEDEHCLANMKNCKLAIWVNCEGCVDYSWCLDREVKGCLRNIKTK